MTTLAAVVVHHRRFPDVLETVRSVVMAGVAPESVVVVDNSEDDGIEEALRRAADGWRVLTVPNHGYGAAVNAAMSHLPASDLVLVVTHEVRIDEPSVAALVRAVEADALISAAGPGLLSADGGDVWSRGGVLTRRLRLPRQLVGEVDGAPTVRDVDWIDGACVVYRTSLLVENPFREDFFLYFEETELHTRLRSLGWRVVTVDGATATQGTNGMPAYWGCRNVVLFQRAHGSRTSRLVAPLYFTARVMGIAAIERNVAEVLAAPRGLLAGYRGGAAERNDR